MMTYFKNKEKVKTKQYVDWLINFTENRPNKTWSDEEFTYNKTISETEKENIYCLGFFASYINERYTSKGLSPETNNVGGFIEESIYFKLKDEFYKISIIFGQGAYCEISKIEKAEKNYMELNYDNFV